MNTLTETQTLTEEEKRVRIKELYRQKRALLDTYGLFGGGDYINSLHHKINQELESLGVYKNH